MYVGNLHGFSHWPLFQTYLPPKTMASESSSIFLQAGQATEPEALCSLGISVKTKRILVFHVSGLYARSQFLDHGIMDDESRIVAEFLG